MGLGAGLFGRAPDLAALRRAVSLRGGDAGLLSEGEGRWRPFDLFQRTALRNAYADDLLWLRAGAERLARLAEETGPDKAEIHPPAGQKTRGQEHGIETRHMA